MAQEAKQRAIHISRTFKHYIEPDPTYAPLLALVKETCPCLSPHRTLCICNGTSYLTRTAYWQKAPEGAFAGALYRAMCSIAPLRVVTDCSYAMDRETPDLVAAEVVLKWLEQP